MIVTLVEFVEAQVIVDQDSLDAVSSHLIEFPVVKLPGPSVEVFWFAITDVPLYQR